MTSTLAPPEIARARQPQGDPDALIKEARDRQRRRRRRGAAVVVVVLSVAAVAAIALRSRGDDTAGVVRVPGGPVVNVSAFSGHGRLAFISGRAVWVLDGGKRSLHQIRTGAGGWPSQPLFAPDGRWLAFVQTTTRPWYVPGSGAQTGQLWFAHGDGGDAHPLRGLAHVRLVGWSSRSDTLAVIAGPVSKRVPFESPTTVRLVTPNGRDRVRVRARGVRSATWSPDGRALAVVTEDAHLHMTLASYPSDGGRRTIWGRFGPRTHLNGMTQIVVDVAGWWRGLGVGVWVYGDGMVHNNDATPLDLIPAAGSKPRFLANTLSDGTTRVLASAGGRLAVVADVSHGINGGRVVWDAKQLQVCTARGCAPVTTGRREVTLDPSWSNGGRLLAYVQAPDRTTGPWTQRVVSRWYANHQLRVLDVRTGRSTTLPAAGGATVPIWSPDGTGVLFVGDDGIWLLPRLRGKPVEIARPLFDGAWPNYYGQMAWPAQFAWWSR